MKPAKRKQLARLLVFWLVFIFLIGLIPMVALTR